MSGTLKVLNEQDLRLIENGPYEFELDVLHGLSKVHKEISPKYFYDKKGSEIFNEITRLPEYYLTNCELHILENNKRKLAEIIPEGQFDLIELGPGEGIKTQIIIEEFIKDHLNFTYRPIDIAETSIRNIISKFNKTFPKLTVNGVVTDYFKGLKWLTLSSQFRKIVLFLGSSIGNFDPAGAKILIQNLWNILQDGDYVLIGFDLRKDINKLMNAYNDPQGLTREFNFNLLKRMNQELGANFNLDKFFHHAVYNAVNGAMESYLVSTCDQIIRIDNLAQSIHLDEWEPIHLEYSYKYLLKDIITMGTEAGFEIIQNFIDEEHYFVDSLWRVCKKGAV